MSDDHEACWCGTINEYDGAERHYGTGGEWRSCMSVVRSYLQQAKDDPLDWAPNHPDGTVSDCGGYIAELVRLLEAALRRIRCGGE